MFLTPADRIKFANSRPCLVNLHLEDEKSTPLTTLSIRSHEGSSHAIDI
jgi:hypothetical protein